MTDNDPKPKKLSTQHQRFVDAYLGEAKGNATTAAAIAGYKDPGQSGWRLKKNEDIRRAIDERLAAETMSSQEVLAELTDIGRADWRDFLQIKRDKDGEIIDAKIVLADKVKSLELLGKFHQLFVDRVQSEGEVTVNLVGVDPEAI